MALPVTQTDVVRAKGVDLRTRHWILNDLTPMSRKEAKAKAGWLFRDLYERTAENAIPMFYRCKWFDAVNRRCTNYEDRPPACRGYPWGDKPPRPGTVLPPMCAFRADIGKPVEPMPVEWQSVQLGRKP